RLSGLTQETIKHAHYAHARRAGAPRDAWEGAAEDAAGGRRVAPLPRRPERGGGFPLPARLVRILELRIHLDDVRGAALFDALFGDQGEHRVAVELAQIVRAQVAHGG